MAAVDYARLRSELGRSRLLFVAHREEILDQSRATFRHALRDAAFGEKWVGGQRPERFEHVFASIQSLHSVDVRNIDPTHFDVVIVDEFHHAAAPSYEALLDHVQPSRAARADGDARARRRARCASSLRRPNRRRAAALGCHRPGVPRAVRVLRRSRRARPAQRPVAARPGIRRRSARRRPHGRSRMGPSSGRGGPAEDRRPVAHARARLLRQRRARPLHGAALHGARPACRGALGSEPFRRAQGRLARPLGREAASRSSRSTSSTRASTSRASTRCSSSARRTARRSSCSNSGRGLRKAAGKGACTVLDFVGTHRKEFRFDRRLRALLGGSRADVERQVRNDFPFLPAGCSFDLDPVAREIVLRSIREAIPSTWRERCEELRSLGDVSLGEYLESSGLELEDVYAGGHSWTEMRREVGLATEPGRTGREATAARRRPTAARRR